MIFVIIGVIVFGVWFYLTTKDWLIAILGVVVGLFVGFMVWIPVGAFMTNHVSTEQVLTKEETLYTLDNTLHTENDVFLWIGETRNHVNYKYVIDSENGRRIEKISGIYDVYINEGDYEPKVEYYHCEYANRLWCWVALPLVFKDEYIFYVPEGTIATEYNINLK